MEDKKPTIAEQAQKALREAESSDPVAHGFPEQTVCVKGHSYKRIRSSCSKCGRPNPLVFPLEFYREFELRVEALSPILQKELNDPWPLRRETKKNVKGNDDVRMSQSRMVKSLERRRDFLNVSLLEGNHSKNSRTWLIVERDSIIQILARYHRLQGILGESSPYGSKH